MRDKRIFARHRSDHRATSAYDQRATAGHHWRNNLRTTAAIGRATCAASAPTRAQVDAPHAAAASRPKPIFFCFQFQISRSRCNSGNDVLKDPSLCSDTTVGTWWRIRIPLPGAQRKNKNCPESVQYINKGNKIIHRMLEIVTLLASRRLAPTRFTRKLALHDLTDFAWTETPLHDGRNKSGEGRRVVADGRRVVAERDTASRGPTTMRLRNHNFGLAQRIMVKRLATSPHDPIGITDSACKNQLVVVSVQYDPFITYIPIRSTTIGKSRVARDPIAMHTSWRSNSDIASVTR
ncbi:hypothetical protein F511_19677 [Dorcoceras hygrometricum]|uniref:Uncharacterized protein n=1 Tax=Dorcoceras hygrometricum TaxID=472368 RepID=A0A2Z7CAH0_9LAMI|nr:hypothetical protein F511_19677 [Dorcoceras hygrometricum]